MSRVSDLRRFKRLVVTQRLACDQGRYALGASCEATDARVAAEKRSLAEQEFAISELDATFRAPWLCVDRLSRAVQQFHCAEAALAEARHSTRQARAAEDLARTWLNHAEQQLELVGDITRTLRRKHADKRENEATLQALAVNLSRMERP
jgi:hypothetical protein